MDRRIVWSMQVGLTVASVLFLFAACGGEPPATPPACAAGEQRCAERCVDLARDPGSCGACGVTCAAGELCAAGTCRASCPSGTRACGGTCSNIARDAKHCGACGEACIAPANAVAECVAGTCGFRCAPNFGDCNGRADDGCETDLTNDANNCGVCSYRCVSGTQTYGTCIKAQCGFGCAPGFADCNRRPTDGCEAALATDRANCGRCGTTCSKGATCVGGKCCGVTASTFKLSSRANLYFHTDKPPATGSTAPVVVAGVAACGGRAVTVTASGCVVDRNKSCTGPDGAKPRVHRGLHVYGLIGQWSTSPTRLDASSRVGNAFNVGNKVTTKPPAEGGPYYLFLAENDGVFSDNSGAYTVSVH